MKTELIAKEAREKYPHHLEGRERFAYIAGANQENERLIKLIESAFVAGRSQTTWKQFKKDNDL